MKKLLVIVLALTTFVTYSQDSREQKRKEIRRNITREANPEKQAEIQTKRLALALDLDKNQQEQTLELLNSHFASINKSNEGKKDRKTLTEEERHELKVSRLNAQIALKEKMKEILNDDQYKKYSQMLGRRMKGMKDNMKGRNIKRQKN